MPDSAYTSPAIAEAVGALCRLSGRLPLDDRALLMPALVILSEALAETTEQPQPVTRKQLQLERLATLEQQLHDREPGERAATIRERMRISKSAYYRMRLEAQQQELLP